jgi:hypothetical protein
MLGLLQLKRVRDLRGGVYQIAFILVRPLQKLGIQQQMHPLPSQLPKLSNIANPLHQVPPRIFVKRFAVSQQRLYLFSVPT